MNTNNSTQKKSPLTQIAEKSAEKKAEKKASNGAGSFFGNFFKKIGIVETVDETDGSMRSAIVAKSTQTEVKPQPIVESDQMKVVDEPDAKSTQTEVKPKPDVEATQTEAKSHPVVETDQMLGKTEPVLKTPQAQVKPEPIVETNPEKVVETKPEPVVETNPEPVVETNPEPVVQTVQTQVSPDAVVEFTKTQENPEPQVTSTLAAVTPQYIAIPKTVEVTQESQPQNLETNGVTIKSIKPETTQESTQLANTEAIETKSKFEPKQTEIVKGDKPESETKLDETASKINNTQKQDRSPVVKADKKVREKVTFGLGINLIPPRKEEEIVHEEKKSRFNISAALAILIFVVLSVGILGYNLYLKQQLSDESKKLVTAEANISQDTVVLRKNLDLAGRIGLYRVVQEGTTSYKEVFDYWKKISDNMGTITSIELGDELSFDVIGSTDELLQVSKLWHFLSIDDRILDVNLKSVNKGIDKVMFEFEGKLNFEYFRNK